MLPCRHFSRFARVDERHIAMKRIPVRLSDPSFDIIPLIAHDLRTPLTAIKGLSQLALRRSDIPAPAAHYLSTSVDEANHIATLVDDMVLASRLERGEVEARLSNVDVLNFLQSILEDLPNLEESPRPVFVSTKAPCVAHCDPQVLARAIIRLLAVIARRARSNESVLVSVLSEPMGIEIWIAPRPNGHIPNGPVKRATQAPFQADDRADGSSPNLSVYLAAKLIEAQRGHLQYGDAPEGYARFHVSLLEARDS